MLLVKFLATATSLRFFDIRQYTGLEIKLNYALGGDFIVTDKETGVEFRQPYPRDNMFPAQGFVTLNAEGDALRSGLWF